MKHESQYPQRKRVRITAWDYRQSGFYSITICTNNRACSFGFIRDCKVELTALGCLVQSTWLDLPNRNSNISLDEFVVMPNHLHGILIITDGPPIHHDADIKRSFGKIQPHSISSMIRTFKARVTRKAGRKVWQSGFHEHIIQNDEDLANHRAYIRNNPLQWEHDRENPDFVGR
ncbi:MAG: transposase [Calditrichota bacterium]